MNIKLKPCPGVDNKNLFAIFQTKPQVKTPAESRPGDWQCSNEECGNINL